MTRNFDLANIDKLGVNFTMKIPEITKAMIDELDPERKKGLKLALLITMAKCLHDARFDPSLYLSSKTSTDTLDTL